MPAAAERVEPAGRRIVSDLHHDNGRRSVLYVRQLHGCR